jgi:hypothetical protein
MLQVAHAFFFCFFNFLQVADLYEGTLDILQANRANALRCQWHECKPWRESVVE